jgi:hypothetical protein
MSSVFDFLSHFDYLKARLDPRNSERGIKTRFAESLRILPAFLSQVLREKYSLTLEQADLANQFFGHNAEEAEFFLLLTSKDRAGTVSLRKIYERQIQNLLEKRKMVIERLGRKAEISDEGRGVYYSSWLYSAVHVACTIESLRNRKALSAYLGVPDEVLEKVLSFLEENSLLSKSFDSYLPTQNWVRLGKDSPHIVKHHTNWRIKAIQNLEQQTNDDLHYSGIYSIDEKTALQVKDEFLEYLKQQTQTFENAVEEDLYVLGLDFFKPFKGKNRGAK